MLRRVVLAIVVVAVVAGLAALAAPARPGPAAVAKSCRPGSKPAIIAGNFVCLRAGQKCNARYQSAYKKYGFRCVSGRLEKGAKPPPPPQPPPPPPPPGLPGHYKGTTSQSELLEFDVTPDGNFVSNLTTGQINQGCNPADFTLFGFSGQWGPPLIPLSPDASFVLDFSFDTKVDEDPATAHLTVTGHLNGPVGVGNLQMTTNFTSSGVAYTCGSGLQTWTVTRVG